MKLLYTIVISMLVLSSSYAQTGETLDTIKSKDPWKISLNAHYTTQHYWRGLGRGGLFGKAPAFESMLSFSNKKWHIGIFAGASTDNIYKALIPSVLYKVTPQFSVAIQDIYSPGTNFWNSEPFDFDIYTSKHFVDYYMVYKFKKVPIALKWASVVLGADPTKDGDRNFSSYAEISSAYNYKNWGISGAIGYTPWKGLYAKKAGFNNMEAKLQYNFKLYNGKIKLPVYIRGTYNTVTEYAHFIAGTSVTLKLK